ncbi:uncharacterized protein [Hemitrygon akajei]|uniref:uncharacterized protein isoform X1 n=1 Tax=Hemitrygon akajei TaxID=2704970 RepID=UPI003BF9BC6D
MALPIGRRLALLLRRSWTASWRARRQQHQQQREAASRPWPAARARVRACAAGPRAPPLSTSSVGRMASREFNPPLPATDWKVAKKHLEEIDQTERRCYYKSERFVVLDEVPTWKDFSAQEELKQPATHYKKDDILNEKVSLLQEDLTKLEIDAIVNAGIYSTHYTQRRTNIQCAYETLHCGFVDLVQSIMGKALLTIEHINMKSCRWKAASIIRDPHHPGHTLFSLLPSGWRYRSLRTHTTMFKNSYYPSIIRVLNKRK